MADRSAAAKKAAQTKKHSSGQESDEDSEIESRNLSFQIRICD